MDELTDAVRDRLKLIVTTLQPDAPKALLETYEIAVMRFHEVDVLEATATLLAGQAGSMVQPGKAPTAPMLGAWIRKTQDNRLRREYQARPYVPEADRIEPKTAESIARVRALVHAADRILEQPDSALNKTRIDNQRAYYDLVERTNRRFMPTPADVVAARKVRRDALASKTPSWEANDDPDEGINSYSDDGDDNAE